MANNFDIKVNEITGIRLQKDQLNAQLLTERQELNTNKYLLEQAINHNQNGAIYTARIQTIKNNITQLKNSISSLSSQELSLVQNLSVAYGGYDRLVDQMNDQYPILFFPVRLETVFNENPKQLWVRIFPDDIAVDTHEVNLTESEVEEGKMYWKQFVAAISIEEKIQAWDLLCRSFDAERAAWIAKEMTPTNINSNPSAENLIFPNLDSKPDAWSKQPETYVMPDSFVVYAYGVDGSLITHKMNPIPDNLKLGIDPVLDPDEETMSFDQKNINNLENELVADASVDWMIDFNAAISKGMGAKINLTTNQFNQGFNKILVLGVKSTLTVEESQYRLEELLNNHHYTGGLSLLKQGTNTNNTETDYSGYSAVNFGNKTTYNTERLSPLFSPTSNQNFKTDGQVLCEALGIEYDTLFHIFQSNGNDISNAMNFNIFSFQAFFGYTANELLPIFGDRKAVNSSLRNFFKDYIRSRGALPSIRCGNQPYGILPTSVFSRLNWNNDPNRVLYQSVLKYSSALNNQWSNVLSQQGTQSPSQQLSDLVSKHAVSTEYIQRIGVGAGYIWNNIEYSAIEFPRKREWEKEQMNRMGHLLTELDLPIGPDNKALQINYLEKQSNIDLLLSPTGSREDQPLPHISSVGNLLHLIAEATFDELRDENFERYGVPEEMVEHELRPNLLYKSTRQSIMLEFYEAACEILQLDEELRQESEFINIVNEKPRTGTQSQNQGPLGKLSAGESRLLIMNRSYRNQEPISQILSSQRIHEFPEAANLIEAKHALHHMASATVKDLNLLVREVTDLVTYRMDVWRLSLVNQRLNTLRGIEDGSLNRNKGLFFGAYGWVENVKKQTHLNPVAPPTSDNQFPTNIVQDKNNKGFIHAPSLNQAVNGAVMLSAYSQRAENQAEDPLSINLSSERVRTALDLMDGIRNGQNIGVLLGYEFERRFRELYPQAIINQYIYNLRNTYPLDRFVVEVSPDPSMIDKTASRNVVNGTKLIDLLKEDRYAEILTSSGASGMPAAPFLRQSVDWIWNLMDAIADIATAEGVFQIVQGNTVKGGATANALAKGRLLHDPNVIPAIKDGLRVGQRFTMHFDTSNPTTTVTNGWGAITGTNFRKSAEPYINKWLSTMLPDPNNIFCSVKAIETNTEHWVSAKDINLHPIDLMYMMGEDLKDGDDQLSMAIKKWLRANQNYSRDVTLAIDYGLVANTNNYSFTEIHPILLYAGKLIFGSRHLNTHDYISPTELDGVVKEYNITELNTRFTTAKNALLTATTTLQNKLNATTFNKTEVINALYNLSTFGIEQTIYEFVADTTPQDETDLREKANFVLHIAQEKLNKAIVTTPLPATNDDPSNYITETLEAFKQIFDTNYVVLPLFKIRQEEQSYLSLMLNYSSTLKNDHTGNDLLTEEWMSSIAKVKKNAEHYELLSIMSSIVHLSNITSRAIIPLQLPYSNDGTERWLGASVVNNEALKEGRIAIGACVPNGHTASGYQVGIMVEEWMDVIPYNEHTTGISFHYNQPNSKAPQCLILGLTPQITGNWKWNDLVDMLNETLDLAKKRGVDYEEIASTAVGQLPGLVFPFSKTGNGIGLSEKHIINF